MLVFLKDSRGTINPFLLFSIQIRDSAFILRNIILKQTRKPIPSKLMENDIIEGEVEIPPLLQEFFECLVNGPNTNRTTICERKTIRIQSLAEETIFSVTNGRSKPSKQMLLALVMKSVPGSRKAIEILNKFGHCVSYHVAEELETELTYTASESSTLLPYGLLRQSHLHTGMYSVFS